MIKVDKSFLSSEHTICDESLSEKGDAKLRDIIKKFTRKFDQIGSDKAMSTLGGFIQERLTHYHEKRDIPSVLGRASCLGS